MNVQQVRLLVQLNYVTLCVKENSVRSVKVSEKESRSGTRWSTAADLWSEEKAVKLTLKKNKNKNKLTTKLCDRRKNRQLCVQTVCF